MNSGAARKQNKGNENGKKRKCCKEYNLITHGRQRKDRTAEEEALRIKDHAKKVATYRYAMKLIFDKRAKGELDEELMKVTGQILAKNPDIGTLWNIRKECLASLKKTDYDKFSNVVVPKEMDFTEFCLTNNPKSYGAWHHRRWLVIETEFSRVKQELKLCAKYLEFDDRNFHTWDYRRFLVENCSEVTLEQELEFTTEKISSNFSNFSSWHLRSKLLPKLAKDYLHEELELIRNAVFTDPKDQSAWFYHRWLLKSQLPEEDAFLVAVQRTGSKLVIIFNNNIASPSHVSVKFDGKEVPAIDSSPWANPWKNTCSRLWELHIPECSSDLLIETDLLIKQFNTASLKLKPEQVCTKFPSYYDAETAVKSDKFVALLKEELAWVQELQELEPDIKWPVSTLILLMRLIDFVGYKEEILKYLEILSKLDSKRINYYIDLRSKFIVEWKLLEILQESSPDQLINSAVSLANLNLTALYYPERLCFHTTVNLSGNSLKNCEPLKALRNCKDLTISGNKLDEEKVKSMLISLDNLYV